MAYFNRKDNTIYLSSIYSNIPNFREDSIGMHILAYKKNHGRLDVTHTNIKEKLELLGYTVKYLQDLNYYLPKNHEILDEIEAGKFLCSNGKILDESYLDQSRGYSIGIPDIFINQTKTKKGELQYQIYNKNDNKKFTSIIKFLRCYNLEITFDNLSEYFINEILPHMSKIKYNANIYTENDYYTVFPNKNTINIYSWLLKQKLSLKSADGNSFIVYGDEKIYYHQFSKENLHFCYDNNINLKDIKINNKTYKLYDVINWYKDDLIKKNKGSNKSRVSTYIIKKNYPINYHIKGSNNYYFLNNIAKREFEHLYNNYLKHYNFPKLNETDNIHFNFIDNNGFYINEINGQPLKINANKLAQSIILRNNNILGLIKNQYLDFNFNKVPFPLSYTIQDIINKLNELQIVFSEIVNGLFNTNYSKELTKDDIIYIKELFKTRNNGIAQRNERNKLKENNITRRQFTTLKKKYPNLTDEEIFKIHKDKKKRSEDLKKWSKKYNIPVDYIRRNLKKNLTVKEIVEKYRKVKN